MYRPPRLGYGRGKTTAGQSHPRWQRTRQGGRSLERRRNERQALLRYKMATGKPSTRTSSASTYGLHSRRPRARSRCRRSSLPRARAPSGSGQYAWRRRRRPAARRVRDRTSRAGTRREGLGWRRAVALPGARPTSPPTSRMACAVARPASPLTSTQTTLAPCRAKSSALALPMPLPAPVTMATLPLRRGPRPAPGPRRMAQRGRPQQRQAPERAPDRVAARTPCTSDDADGPSACRGGLQLGADARDAVRCHVRWSRRALRSARRERRVTRSTRAVSAA